MAVIPIREAYDRRFNAMGPMGRLSFCVVAAMDHDARTLQLAGLLITVAKAIAERSHPSERAAIGHIMAEAAEVLCDVDDHPQGGGLPKFRQAGLKTGRVADLS